MKIITVNATHNPKKTNQGAKVNKEIGLLSGDGPPDERRADERTATVFRPVLIEAEEFAGFCLVRNLSPKGMKGKVYTQFAEGMPLTIQFNHYLVVSGTVIWCRDGQVGVRFDEIIDVPSVLADLGKSLVNGKVNRAPRLQIQCDGELVTGQSTLVIEAQNISQRGIRARVSQVQPGDEVTVRLEGLEPRRAVVRWSQLGAAGINFVRPLGFEQLARWVISHQIRMLPADSDPISADIRMRASLR